MTHRARQTPANGAWNMSDKKFYKPASISRWCIAVFEKEARFTRNQVEELAQNFAKACANVGEWPGVQIGSLWLRRRDS